MRMITTSHFLEIDARVGKIVSVEETKDTKKPAYRLKVDFGPQGMKKSSAQLTHYTKEQLIGKKVVGIINLAPMQVGQFISEALILGLADNQGKATLPEIPDNVELGSKLF